MTKISKQPPPEPPPELLEQARDYIEAQEWIVASTMPENPHEYVVWFHQHTQEDRDGYQALRELITKHGAKRRWHGKMWRVYDLDGWSYWHIWPIVNRKRSDQAGWED